VRRLVIGFVLLAGLGVVTAGVLAVYSAVELHRFRRAEVGRATLIYAAPQPLRPGVEVRRVDLAGVLSRLRYRETRGAPTAPGEFRRTGAGWDVYLRAVDRGGPQPAQRVRLEVDGNRIARVTRDGKLAGPLVLEPEVLTSGDDVPGEEMRPVRLADVPPTLRNAVLAAEDHRFLEHHGLDLRGVARALWTNLRAARVVQGGSTITQQLVKSRLLSRERTLDRKLREAWLAALVEWRYGKDEILEAYLNEIYLGHRGGLGVRGVGAATRTYFGKEVHQLSLGEAALLGGMIRAPNRTSPVLDRTRARERRDAVLRRMRELGMITAVEHDRARAEPVRARPGAGTGQLAPYFTDHVRGEAEGRLPGRLGARRPVHIVTTLDLPLQRQAEAAVARGIDRLETRHPELRAKDPSERLQAALVALDPQTGEIRAMVGGRDYRASQFNRAALAARQSGSAFKPFVYLAALRPEGKPNPVLTAASFVDDAPIAVPVEGGPPWSPRNFEGRHEGRVTVRRALEASLNAATVRVAQMAGLPAVLDTARTVGLGRGLEPVPAVALGAFEVTPLDLARAYVPLANGGRRFEAIAVSAIHDEDGQTLWATEDVGTPVVSSPMAYLITSLLEGAVRSGTGAGAVDLPAPVAGKTGTTNEGRDAWFVGYSSNLVALVWVGFDGSRAHGLSGARAALPIWTDFMRQALETYPARAFALPEGVALVDIDPTTGQAATATCPLRVREVFLAGTEPAVCDQHESVPELIRRRFWNPFLDWLRR
jgi:penicillin-binding protein 1B